MNSRYTYGGIVKVYNLIKDDKICFTGNAKKCAYWLMEHGCEKIKFKSLLDGISQSTRKGCMVCGYYAEFKGDEYKKFDYKNKFRLPILPVKKKFKYASGCINPRDY